MMFTTALLLAQSGGLRNMNWSIGGIAITIVVIAAVVALVYVALRKFNVVIPEWVISVFWIVVVACVVIGAIKIVIGMW